MKNTLIKGTLTLTFAGFLTRILGFFYRIFLLKKLGSHQLGVYQMIFPIYATCFTIYASGIQTAVSQLVSSNRTTKVSKNLLRTACLLSVILACTTSIILFYFANAISCRIFRIEECAPLIRILCFIFPICGITSITNGVYYGLQHAQIPAVSQILEQLGRILVVFLVAIIFANQYNLTAQIAVVGLVAGELTACIYNLSKIKKYLSANDSKRYLKSIISLAVPLSGSRLILSLLNSLEAILIPAMLITSGMSSKDSVSVYGLLTGIVFPFILFPGALTNSLSVLLLPKISYEHSKNNTRQIIVAIEETVKYALLLGILFFSIFHVFGSDLGNTIFHSKLVGQYLSFASMLCPFIYCSTTLSSIINGLGKTYITFQNNVIGLSVRIVFLVLLIPKFGIYSYLLGYLLSQILITTLDGMWLYSKYRFHLNPIRTYGIPCSLLLIIGNVSRKIIRYISHNNEKHSGFTTLLLIPILCILYYIYLKKQNIILEFKKKSL